MLDALNSLIRLGQIFRTPLVLIVGAAFLAPVLAGCKTAPETSILSAEEAKQVAINLSNEDLGAPPRSLADLEPLPTSLADISSSPSCVIPAEKITLADLDAASPRLPWSYHSLGKKEIRAGQLTNAIAYQTKAIQSSGKDHADDIAGYTIFLATYYAKAGNFDKANSLYSESRSNLSKHTSDVQGFEGCNARNRYWLKRAEGMINLAKGELVAAEQDLIEGQRHRSRMEELPGNCASRGLWEQAELRLSRAEAVLWLGRITEAETLAREAFRLSEGAKAQALVLLSQIFFEQGRYSDSLRVALGAIAHLDEICAPSDALQRARAYESAGRAFIGLRRWNEAEQAFATLEALMQTDPETWERRFKINRDRGIALLRSGNIQEARDVLEAVATEQARRLGPEDYQVIETRAFLAMARAASGDLGGALVQMRETVPALLDRWREGAGDSVNQVGRTFRVKLVAEVYLSLLLDWEKGGDSSDGTRIAEAFQIADGVSTRGVQRALAQSTARSLAKDPATEELVRQRQDLEKQVAALRSRFNDAHGSKEAATPEVLGALRSQIEQAEAALRGLEQEVARVFPEYAALTNPKPVSLSEARESLEPGEALVLTFAGEDQLFVLAVPKDGTALAHVAPLGRAGLKDRVDALRAALAPYVQTLGDIPAYDIAEGYKLYQQLLEPVSTAWKDEKRLLVVADGPLGTLPFAVLPKANEALAPDDATLFDGYRQVPWLARSHALAQLPSVASLINLRRTQVSQENRFAFVGFGDPWFDRDAEQVATAETRGVMRGVSATDQPIQLRNLPQTRAADTATLASLPRLPDTAEEILAVAETLGANLDRDVYIGLEASERKVKDLSESGELKKYRTLSFATHGLVPGDLDGLVKPALAMAAPTPEEAEQGDDGLLTSGEILGLRLDADWAVLSACNTAAADGAGAEAVSGLGRAFFYAGAKAILVSNWPVHSDATRSLMTELFANYAAGGSQDRADALQTAMQYMIDEGGFEVDGERIFSYAHPIFWAPFVVVGDGG